MKPAMDAMRKVEVLRAACCVAGADGEVAATERPMLDRLASEIGVGYASLSAMIERAETDNQFYEDQFRVLQAAPDETMRLLFQVAAADGRLKRGERLVLKRLAVRLRVGEELFDRWLAVQIERARTGSPRRKPG